MMNLTLYSDDAIKYAFFLARMSTGKTYIEISAQNLGRYINAVLNEARSNTKVNISYCDGVNPVGDDETFSDEAKRLVETTHVSYNRDRKVFFIGQETTTAGLSASTQAKVPYLIQGYLNSVPYVELLKLKDSTPSPEKGA